MIKFSVVIPIYNAEKTLSKCIDSVLCQPYKNIEIILVNDGSKDKSYNICCQYREKDGRIYLVNKKNEGVAIARNVGLNNATGDYIYFIDPDDWIESSLFMETVDILNNIQPDVLLFGHIKEVLINRKIKTKMIYPGDFIIDKNNNTKRELLSNMYQNGAGFSAWDKLIKKDFLINYNLKFPLLKRGQDMAFCADVFYYSQSIVSINKTYYHYIDQNLTNSNKCDPKIIENHLFIFKKIARIFCDDIRLFYEYLFLQNIFLLWFSFVIPNSIMSSNLSNIEKKRKINQLYHNREFLKLLSCFSYRKCMSKKNRILLYIIRKRKYFITVSFIKIANIYRKRKLYN